MSVFLTAPGQITLTTGEYVSTLRAIRELRQAHDDIGALEFLVANQLVRQQGNEYVLLEKRLVSLYEHWRRRG